MNDVPRKSPSSSLPLGSEDRALGFATICVHGRRRFDKHDEGIRVRAISTPIFMSSTFAFENAEQGARIFAGEEEGYAYTRLGNPTQSALEREVAFLEGGEAALAFASGMAAEVAAVLTHCGTGDQIVAGSTLYGGTYQLFAKTLPRLGIETTFVDARNARTFRDAITPRTKLFYVESPSNPTLDLTDLAAVASIAREAGIPLMVDNTFATPYYQQPLSLGADIVIHSATKYIGGHGDTIAGLLIGGRDFIEEVRGHQLRDLGAAISPFNAWLLLRGLKTLPVRMERHTASATEVAQYLAYHPKVARVHYPGLRTHPQHELMRRQMRGAGGILSFELRGGREAGRRLMNSVKLWTLAVSLGDVDSLIQHPATMTHSTYGSEELARVGISEGLVRLSVGLEDVRDLIEDLKQALQKV